MSTSIYSRLSTYGGISLEYADIGESVFVSVAGAAYTPPERGDFRRVGGTRLVQLLQECPGVVETFQTSAGTLRLPANTVSEATNDAGDGRIFFLKNSGTGNIVVEDYLGASLYTLSSGSIVIIMGNTANTWDFLSTSASSLLPGVNVSFNGSYIDVLTLFSTTTSASTISLLDTSESQQVFTGTTAGQNVDFPDATTLDVGRVFVIWNDSTQVVAVNNNSSALLVNVPGTYRGIFTLTDNSTSAGVWTWMLMTESGSTSGLATKAGIIPAISFSGSPKTATVTFATSFSSGAYTITLTGVDKRSWSYESKTAAGFTINASANQALTDEVSWQALLSGETI